MRIAIVNRYFWPENVLVNKIAQWYASAGHEVNVFTGQPDYNPEAKYGWFPAKETHHAVKIRRYSLYLVKGRGILRELSSIYFLVRTCFQLCVGKKYDVIWSTSIPPVIQPFLLRIVGKIRGTKFIYFPQDIYPEIAISSQLIREGVLSRTLKFIDTWTMNNSDAVITISHDMLGILSRRGVSLPNMKVIRSFSPIDLERPLTKKINSSQTRFLFAGNIGRFQNLEALIRSFAAFDGNDASLTFMGDGREKSYLQSLVIKEKYKNIDFIDSMPFEDAFNVTVNYDVGIVCLMPGIYQYAFPAKFYTYIGAGIPILAIVENESELAKIVESRAIGVTVSWEEGLSAVSLAISDIVENYARYRHNIMTNTDDLYKSEVAMEKWIQVLDEI